MAVNILIGCLLGFLSGLGAGGGSLLILWLSMIEKMPAEDARAINLMFFVPSALIACLFRYHQGSLNLKKVLPAIVAGSISAGAFSLFRGQWDSLLLKKFFGAFLILAGIRELLYKPKESPK